MVVLSLIGETLTDFEHEENTALLRTLSAALGKVAPKGCSLQVLHAKGTELPDYENPRISAVQVPLRAGSLPILWQNGASARPLDGELMHSVSPMAPLRSRTEDDGSQTTVTVPHMLAWQDPDRYSGAQLRALRSFIKRATKHADVIVTPNYATADLITDYFGSHINVQVLPFAPLAEFTLGADADARAERLELPEQYLVTTARADKVGRLEWLANAVMKNDAFPPLVVIGEVGGQTVVDDGADDGGGPDAGAGAAGAGGGGIAGTGADASGGTAAQVDAARDEVSSDGGSNSGRTLSAHAGANDALGAVPSAQAPAAPIYQLPPELKDHPNLRENAAQTADGDTGGGSDAEDSRGAGSQSSASRKISFGRGRSKAVEVDPLAEIAAKSNGRVIVVHPQELADIGVIIGKAQLLVLPQEAIGVGHEVYGAIASGVPVVHAELGAAEEIALDAGLTFDSPESLAATLEDVLSDEHQVRRLQILARDRANFFSWDNVAWSLWELHANL